MDLNRPEDVKKTVTALANLIRANVKGKELLPVREELKHIDQYMYINKMRYGDKLLFYARSPRA